MTQREDGGPALLKCARCPSLAIRYQGHQWLCALHYRFGQMRAKAKQDGKAVPTHEQLTAIAGDVCADCGVRMNWLAKSGQTTVATLQHYRDGTFGIVCRSCNTRHAYMPGDSYRDMPKDHKRCPKCEQEKPFSAFAADNGRSGPMKLKSWCKECSGASHTEWQRNNRDHYNAKQRESRAGRRAAG